MARQVLGGGFADITDAERENEARERRLLALFDGGEQVGGGFFRHAIKTRDLPGIESVKVGRRVHDAVVDQLVDQFLAQTLDVHGAARGEMQKRLLALRRAIESAGAADRGLARLAHDPRAAHRAGGIALQDVETRRRRMRTPLLDHRHHLGNDVARPAHDDAVALAHVEALDLVLVVQGGVGDGDAADEHGFEARNRGQYAGAPHLHLDGLDRGEFLLGRKLVGAGPARLARDETELRLQFEAVDLVHHAVDVERQAVAAAADVVVERDQPSAPFTTARSLLTGRPRSRSASSSALCVAGSFQPATSPTP